jgi:trans-aconitate methyltransferase
MSRIRRGTEAGKASAYWASLTDYHLTNDDDPIAHERSRWLADTIVPMIAPDSLLEVGTNSGRNLQYISQARPQMILKGIDVNARAIALARSKRLPITFEVADANDWAEAADSWDAVLTMSVLDHIPDEGAETLAEHISESASAMISVELWDGTPGTRGVYKYSRNTRELFERHGFETLLWEKSRGQYDEDKSLLWLFVGRRLPAGHDS